MEAWQICKDNSIWSPKSFKQEIDVDIFDEGKADNMDVDTFAKGKADNIDGICLPKRGQINRARPEALELVNSTADEEGAHFP